MLALKRNDIVDAEEVVDTTVNSYCGYCSDLTCEKTWEKHVKSSLHVKAVKRFKFLYEPSIEEVWCKLCCCEVAWEDKKQHESSHFLVPWDSTETSYNKYEIFFENMILLWNNLFGCCLCGITFAEWSVALVHVTDPKHQSLKQENARKFDNTMITSETELSFKLLVEEGIFAFDEMSLECKLCRAENIPISRVVRHLKSLIHHCKKSKFYLNPPAEISVGAQLVSPSFNEAASAEEKALENCDEAYVQNDYLVRINENQVLCVICAVEMSCSVINIRSHNQGKAHTRTFEKYDCRYISREDGNVFHCKLCEYTFQTYAEVHIHIKGEKHSEASKISPVRNSSELTGKASGGQASSSLRKLNATDPSQRISQLTMMSSSLRKPNCAKPHEGVIAVKNPSSSLALANLINSSEEMTRVKQFSTPPREPINTDQNRRATPVKMLAIPTRRPFSIESAEAVTGSKAITSFLRRPNSVEPRRDQVQGQEHQDSYSESDAPEAEGQITASEKLLQVLLPKNYSNVVRLENKAVNNNITVPEDPNAFKESFEYVATTETTAFCHLCRCALSPSPESIRVHALGRQHRMSFRAYGCDHIERTRDATYFCRCCNVRHIALEQFHSHIITPKHLCNVRDDRGEKPQTFVKPNERRRIIENTETSESEPNIFQAAISPDDMADDDCTDVEKATNYFVGNDIIGLENCEYFCIRCSCQISGIPNVQAHVAGKKHQKR